MLENAVTKEVKSFSIGEKKQCLLRDWVFHLL